jgi:endoribonuclease Dicer
MHEADEDKSSKINGIPVPAKRPLLTSAALAARTTDAVIADLKQTNRKLPLVDLPTHDVASIGPLPSLSSGSSVNGHSDGYGAEDKEGAEEGADDDNDEDVEDVPTARPKKITERKRRQNAIADSYLQDALQDPAKKHKVLPQDEANQSTRYMVHQAESRQIISSPREYQIELFERAKAKNTIAVLDTGQYPVLILHFIR